MGQKSSLNIVVLGRVGAPFGVQGWVHLQSYTSPSENILSYENWFIRQVSKEEWHPIRLLQIRVHGKQFVALLENCLNRDQAQIFTNAELGICRDELPELDQGDHYWEDLIGLNVFTETGIPLGTVDSLFETGANDVIVVKETLKGDLDGAKGQEKKEKERLIPFIPDEVILTIDLEERKLIVRWDPEF